LAEVHFSALAGCQTNLTLESAGLAIRDASGFAAPLPGVVVGEQNIVLNIDHTAGEQIEQPLLGTPLALGPTSAGSSSRGTAILIILVVVVGTVGIMFGFYILWRKKSAKASR
jgi:hypothetical protein